jgi:hypothetical protein
VTGAAVLAALEARGFRGAGVFRGFGGGTVSVDAGLRGFLVAERVVGFGAWEVLSVLEDPGVLLSCVLDERFLAIT